jgi:hypothetical protein
MAGGMAVGPSPEQWLLSMRQLDFGDVNRALLTIYKFTAQSGDQCLSHQMIEPPLTLRLDERFRNTIIRSLLGRLNYRNRESIARLLHRMEDQYPAGRNENAAISLLDLWCSFAKEFLTKRETYLAKPHSYETWRQHFQALDQDLVPLADLAREIAKGVPFDIFKLVMHLRNWRTFISGDDRQFQQEIANGIACQHLHLSGAYPAPYYWVGLMNGRFDPDQILQVLQAETRGGRYDELNDVKEIISRLEFCQEIRHILYCLAQSALSGKTEDETACGEKLKIILRRIGIEIAANQGAPPFVPADHSKVGEHLWKSAYKEFKAGKAKFTDYAQRLFAQRGIEPHHVCKCPSLVGERAIILLCFMRLERQADAAIATEVDNSCLGALIAPALWYYLQTKSGLLSILEQREGITGFDYFEHTLRLSPWTSVTDEQETCAWEIGAFLQESGALMKLELMIAPQPNTEEYRRKLSFIKTIQNHLEASASSDLIRRYGKPRVGVIVHFIKTPGDAYRERLVQDGDVFKIFHFSLRDRLAEQSRVLINFLHEQLEVNLRTRDKASGSPEIIGIDAANHELYCPPEIFAETFEILAREYVGQATTGVELRKTFHVGEDFAYMMTGLRRIYEAVRFLNIGPGDRLGHCVALGTNARRWLHNNSAIRLHLIDILDDAVFEWHLLLRNRETSPQRVQQLENRIAIYSMKIFGETIAPHVLERAWLERGRGFRVRDLKFGDNESVPLWIRIQGLQLSRAQADRGAHNIVPIPCVPVERRKDHQFASLDEYFAPLNLSDRILKEYLYDRHTIRRAVQIESFDATAEAQHIEAVQSELSNLITTTGITIESNPSSNWLIGGFERISDVPAVQWALKGVDFPISINPDDPVTFATSLENEYFFVYACLLRGDERSPGLSREQALDVIRRLRQRALKTSFL